MTTIDHTVPLRERIIERVLALLPHHLAVQALHEQIGLHEAAGDMETSDHVRLALSRLCDREGHMPCEEAPSAP